MRKVYILLITSLFQFYFSQIPVYYGNIDFTQSSEDIRTDLNILLSNTLTNSLPYTSSSITDVWDVVKVSDLDPEDATNQNVFLLYGYNDADGVAMSDRTRNRDLSCHSSSCVGLWNREHVYPKSIGSFDTEFPGIGTDVHNIRACDSQMNGSKSNRIFQDDSGNAHITAMGNWYPGDEWKGDIARIIMYMEVLYPANTWANQIGYSSNSYHPDMPDVFLQWNVEDPVSIYEMQRNNHIHSVQGNRNPFIDNPYLATILWGGENAENTWQELSVEEEQLLEFVVYPNPTSELVFYKTDKEIKSIKVYSSLGELQQVDKDLNDNRVELPTRKGIYYLQFEFTDYKTKLQEVIVK